MDRWAWEQLTPWLQLRATLPVGALVLRVARSDRRPSLGARGGAHATTPRGGESGSPTPLRATPAQTRPRRGDVT